MSEEVVASTEAVKDPKKKRQKITDYILKVMTAMDPSGDNTKRWKEFLGGMSDTKFAEFMELIRKKEYQLNLIAPNMKKILKISDLVNASKVVGRKLSHRLWLRDKVTGRKYLTNNEHLVLTLPIRRAQQEWDKKLSVPARDKTVDALSGQVVGEDKACSISAPEIQSLGVRGLKNTMLEVVKVRGGDVTAYGDFKRQMQENGRVTLQSLDPRTRVRSADMVKVLFRGMHIDCNV